MMDQLLQAYRSKRLILFAGAGISMGLGLPSWRQLVDHMAKEQGFDPDIYRTFGSELTLAEFYRITKGQIGPLRSWMDREWHASSTDISKSRVHELIADCSSVVSIGHRTLPWPLSGRRSFCCSPAAYRPARSQRVWSSPRIPHRRTSGLTRPRTFLNLSHAREPSCGTCLRLSGSAMSH